MKTAIEIVDLSPEVLLKWINLCVPFYQCLLSVYEYCCVCLGSGKTMLMDMFHQTCSVSKKQRVHFHRFMLDVHRRM